MPTTPVDIDIQTDPDGTVHVSIEIAGAGSAGVASTLQGSQIDGGEYGLMGLLDSWVTSQSVGPNVFQEIWYIKTTQLGEWKTGAPAWNTDHIGAYSPMNPGAFLKGKGQDPANYSVISQVAAYQDIRRWRDLPIPRASGNIANNFRLKVYNSTAAGGWVHAGYLFRSCAVGGPWEDTWALLPNFLLGDDTTKVKVEEDNTQSANPMTWRQDIGPLCVGGQFLKILYPEP